MHFVETFSVYTFAPDTRYGEVLPDERLRRLWSLLRDATLIILRPLDTSVHRTAEEAADAAHALLFQFGEVAETALDDE